MSTHLDLNLIDRDIICNQKVNVFGTIENPLFLAKEVASWIGHSDTNMMCKTLEKDEKIKIFVSDEFQKRFPIIYWKPCNSSTYVGANYLFLTEFGVYEVLMQSRLPKAKEFKRGVKEILKRIRLTGKYESNPKANDDRSSELIEALKENNTLLRQALIANNNARQHEVRSVDVFDQYNNETIENGPYYSISTIAKQLNTTAQYLNNMMSKEGYIVNKDGSWFPTQKLMNLPAIVCCKRTFRIFGDINRVYVVWNRLGFNLINYEYQKINGDKSLFDEAHPF